MSPEAPAYAKLIGLTSFACAVVALPRLPAWPYGVLLVVVLVGLARARASVKWTLQRLAIEIPFVFFAVLLPFLATGPRLQVGSVELSIDGLIAAWGIVAKATLCVLAALTFAATTTSEQLVAGLRRLRVPDLLVQITSFMVRYTTVVGDEWTRMNIAWASRGFDARTPRSWPTLGRGLGLLFIRSYERGERVHRALWARGYEGELPATQVIAARPSDWIGALTPTVIAVILGVGVWLL